METTAVEDIQWDFLKIYTNIQGWTRIPQVCKTLRMVDLFLCKKTLESGPPDI